LVLAPLEEQMVLLRDRVSLAAWFLLGKFSPQLRSPVLLILKLVWHELPGFWVHKQLLIQQRQNYLQL